MSTSLDNPVHHVSAPLGPVNDPIGVVNEYATGLVPFNSEYLLYARGLQNTGNLCYFNSLLQLLGSMPSLVEYVVGYTGKSTFLKLLRALWRLWQTCPAEKGNATNDYSSCGIVPAHPHSMSTTHLLLFNELCNMFAKNNIALGNSQEDVSEILIKIIDLLNDNVISGLFRGRYMCNTFCRKCRTKKDIKSSEWFVNYIHPNEVSQHLHATALRPEKHCELNMFLKNNYSTLSDSCECGGDMVKTQRMTMVPTILVVAFTRLPYATAGTSNPIQYPPELFFSNPSMKNKYTYKLVGVVKHFGNHSGGHYTAVVNRMIPGAAPHASSSVSMFVEINDAVVYGNSVASSSPSNNMSGAWPDNNVYLVAYHYDSTVVYW